VTDAAGDIARQALKDTAQGAVQEGINQGVKKLFGWQAAAARPGESRRYANPLS